MVPNKRLDHYLEKIANGDKTALSQFYQETNVSLYGYILSIVKNSSFAEEVLQDTYIQIWEKADMYQAKEKPLAWIFTIARNLSLMKIRKEKNHSKLEDFDPSEKSHSQKIEDRLFLSYLFQSVSEEERMIVLLHVISGFRYLEIAKMMNLPLGTVLSKYNRTIQKLKKIAKKEEEHYET